MLAIKIDNRFSYHKEKKLFSVFSSDLDLPAKFWNGLMNKPVELFVELTNPKTGVSREFRFTHSDYTDNPTLFLEDREVVGWNYESKDDIKLLIIND